MFRATCAAVLSRWRRANWFGIIAVVALVVRLTWSRLADRFDPVLAANAYHGDAVDYHALAIYLGRGLGYTWDTLSPTAYRMPGYPVFLALIYAVAGQAPLLAARVFQSAVGAELCRPVYDVARRTVGERAALLAALGVAVYPLLVYMTGWLYSETLYITLLWVALAKVSRALQTPRQAPLLSAGVWFGLAVYVRPESALVPAFMAAVAWVLRWKAWRIKVFVVSQVVVVAMLLPWAARNGVQLGAWTWLTTSGGSNLYAGNNPEATGGAAWVYPVQGVSEVESDRILAGRAVDWITSYPGDALALLPRKALKFFSPLERETGGGAEALAAWVQAPFALFMVAAAVGAFRLRRCPAAVMLVALSLWYFLTAIVFYGGSRVALPVVPAWIILAIGAFTGRVRPTAALTS